MWPELLQAVVDAIKEYLVVDMLALCEIVLVDLVLFQILISNIFKVKEPIWSYFSTILRKGIWILSALFPALFQIQIKIK